MNIVIKKLIVLFWLCFISAAGQAKAQIASREKPVKFQETKLKNGLRILLLEDHSAPVIALDISYDVGARNERQGRTGFAHLFEHMMFKGSENVGRGEHFYQIKTSGGDMNGQTDPDRTIYFEVLPSNQLDMGLFLEADRMRSLAITKENLDNQRNAVQDERRQFIDNAPYGKSQELQQALLYDDSAYKHGVIGSMDDLNAASVEDVAQFFKTYYAPNNAVLVLVGDFNSKEAIEKIKKNFDSIPRQPEPQRIKMNEPMQTTERRQTVEDPLVRQPRINIAFKAVAGNTVDYFALELISAILQAGESSRLYQKLVKERQLVTSISGNMDERSGPGALYLTAVPRPNVKTEEVEAAIYEELSKLATEQVSDAELQKVKNIERRAWLNSLQTARFRAIFAGSYAVKYNDPNLIFNLPDKLDRVTKEDVRRAAQKYLGQSNRTVIITLPKTQDVGASSGAAWK